MNKRSIAFFAALILAAVFLAACVPNAPSGEATLEKLGVSILKVGKADAIVLRCGEGCMVIDAGEDDDGEELCAFLNKSGVSRVDALIITHFDKDHVGGADRLVERFPIERVIVPDYESGAKQYLEFLAALEKKSLSAERLSANIEFDLGSAHILVEPPTKYPTSSGMTETDNDSSLITTVTHGKNRLLFMGDAESYRIRDWLGAGEVKSCDFMKLPHHGVYDKALSELFEAASPKYAAICDSDKNPAEERTLELMKSFGIHAFETRFGNLTVTSDGENLSYEQSGR